jgi:Kef-type K+ transport system membrane component KefB
MARALGALFHGLGQPAVIGEIVAGILLGPLALGWAAPAVARFLIPPDSVAILGVISQLGVILFMFLVGLQLDASGLRRRSDTALAIAHASIVVPFVLGAALAVVLYEPYGMSGVPFAPFALFLGVAMSITAFPVLARILAERGLQRTPLGTLALTVAAVGDVTARLLLAFVVGLVRAEIGGIVVTLGLTLLYIAGLWWVARPLLVRLLGQWSVTAGAAAALMCLLLAAIAAEAIGIHAVFGAFLMGVVIASVWPRALELVAKPCAAGALVAADSAHARRFPVHPAVILAFPCDFVPPQATSVTVVVRGR